MKARIDFHIHSCLSPCASLAMSPRTIIACAQAAQLDCIALTDHGTTKNLPAMQSACVEAGMACLYGIEVTSAEEVHVLCLFDQIQPALDFGGWVYDSLLDFPNVPEKFGEQPIINVDEEIVGFAEKLLFSASSIPFTELVTTTLDAGALCIPAHIDRAYSGAISHLGFLPELPYSALEVVASEVPLAAEKWPVVRFSDAHQPQHIGRRFTEVDTESFSVEHLSEALVELVENNP